MSISQRIAALGGIRGIFHKLVRTKDLRAGTLVGTDENGNKYYEDYTYVFGMMCACVSDKTAVVCL